MMSSVAARMRSMSMPSAPHQMGKAAIEWEAIKSVAVPTFDRVRRDEGVEGRFLDRLGYRVKNLVERGALGPELALTQAVDRVGGPRSRPGNSIGGRKGDEDLAAAIVADRARPPQADVHPPSEATQLARMERKIGREHGDAGSFLVPLRHQVGDLAADRDSRDQHLVPAAVIRLQQHADRKTLARELDDAGRSSDAAFEVEELRARARTNAALRHRPFLGGVECGVDVLPRDAKGTVVAQEAVVRLGYYRDDDVLVGDLRVALGHVADDRVVREADVHRVCEHDRRAEEAPLIDYAAAGHLAIAVEHRDGGVQPLAGQVAGMRPDGCDAAADDGAPTLPSPASGGGKILGTRKGGRGIGGGRFAFPHGLVTDADAGDIRNGVVDPGGKKSHWGPEVAGSASRSRRRRHEPPSSSARPTCAVRRSDRPGRSSSGRRVAG